MPRHYKRLDWTIERACYEFGINPRTLSGRLKQAGTDPDAAGHFTTKQIVQAIYNDLESERIRETRSKADLNEQEFRKRQGLLVDVDEFSREWEPRFVSMVRIVKSSKLTEDEQNQLLGELSQVTK